MTLSLFQNLRTETVLGLANAAIQKNRVAVADADKWQQHSDATEVFIFDAGKIGYQSLKGFKPTTQLYFFNCEHPKFIENTKFKYKEVFAEDKYIDSYSFVKREPNPELAVKYLIALDEPIDISSEVSTLDSDSVWIIGKPINHPKYLGYVDNPDLI